MLLRVLALAALALTAPLALVDAKAHHTHGMIDASNIDATFAAYDKHVSLATHFTQFKNTYGKSYANPDIEAHRFQIFQQNMATAARLQKLNPQATFGVTPFSDLHPVEFKQKYLNYKPAVGDAALLRANRKSIEADMSTDVPTNFDWRAPGDGRPVAVTAVKDQGQCGSCWAFSATEEVESQWILAGNTPVSLAPQQTVDCDNKGSDQGCNGGDTVTAYAYMEGAGLMPEVDYPYTSGVSGNAGTCAYNATEVVAKVKGFSYATPGCNDTCTTQNEEVLATNLYNHGPASICVDASTWQTYTSGILSAASGCANAYTSLDHCVQLVGFGYDETLKQKYWSVRNSWNTIWGEKGYIRLLFGQNTCGVADEATLAQV